ncbi:MAG: type I restriction endonuclease subunit R, partial [Firmicutes bacterium]|nr:type I restriction endonuclease subunit R [Bacillota bacterium]
FVAFTATPKAKTLELFGRRPNPELPAGEGNLPAPFHVYGMRQAIEEGFILDVLKNYTPYSLAFRLASDGQDLSETEVEKSAAMKGIMRWVRLHPYNIAQKVQVVVEHFRANVNPLLSGHAKAMVVVGSRVEAVRWKTAIEKYIREKRYYIGTLVAFSGEVNDDEFGNGALTEHSNLLNPLLMGRDIRDAFDTGDYQILLVANKFQTGFDQPLLCGMYVDKRLAGIQAVQTLSRLNRAYRGPYGYKDTTYILDFVNDPEEILESFRPYYETAELSGVTDPHLVFDLRAKLDSSGYYDDMEVNRVAQVEMRAGSTASELAAAVWPVVDRLLKRYGASQNACREARACGDSRAEQDAQNEMNALLLFKKDVGAFLRVYAFLSQIFHYGNTDLEKRAIFFKRLISLLEFGRSRESIQVGELVLTHHRLMDRGQRDLALGSGQPVALQPMTEPGTGEVQEPEKALLAEIIDQVNDIFEGDLTEADKLVYVNHVLKGKMLESHTLVQQAKNNTKEQFSNSPDLRRELLNAIMDAFSAHHVMSKQALDSTQIQDALRKILLGPAQLYEELRSRSEDTARRDIQ